MKLFLTCLLSLCSIPALANCDLTTPSLNFGYYDAFSEQPNLSSSIITVKCEGNISYELKISAGESHQFNPRYLIGSKGQDKLFYNLYNDISLTTIFGDGTSGTHTYKGNQASVAIYGKIPEKQQVLPGNYSDSLLISVYF